MTSSSPAEAISRGTTGPDGKVCRTLFKEPHMHHGRGHSSSAKDAALAEAIRRWSRFTIWEYGSAWGSYPAAKRKSVDCNKTAAGLWECRVKAQPCKR